MPKSLRPKPAPRRRAPQSRPVAVLLVDVINDLDFPGSGPLIRAAEKMAEHLARLVARAREAGIPVIYVNDNFGRWQSDWRKVVQRCRDSRSPGHRVVRRLLPSPDDYFVLKPKHSGFFSTTLDLLLRNLRTRTVILTGIATDICILFTANDADMRDYEVIVPRDCVAANTRRKTDFALAQIREVQNQRLRSGLVVVAEVAGRRDDPDVVDPGAREKSCRRVGARDAGGRADAGIAGGCCRAPRAA